MVKLYIKLEQLNFKRWSRKKFSIFNSIGKVIKICVLIFTYTLLIINTKAQNKIDTTSLNNQIKVDEIVVSASKSARMYADVARIVEIISKIEVKNTPAQSINDLLEHSLNIDIRQRGAFNIQSDISIRGGSFNQSLILINGTKLIAPQTGHHSLDLPIDFESINNIEILHGPGSKFFGTNSACGAVNIITKNNKQNNISFSLIGGQHNFININLNSSFNIGNFNNYLSFNHNQSAGYIDNTDFKIYNVFLTSNYKNWFGNFFLQAGYNIKKFGANSFYTAKYPDQFETTNTLFTNLKFIKGEKLKFSNSISYRRHQDKFELFRETKYRLLKNGGCVNNNSGDTITWYNGHNFHLTNSISEEANLFYKSSFGETILGFEYNYTNILSNVLGEKLNSPINIPNETNAEYNKQGVRHNYSLFFEQTLNYNSFSINIGIMQNFNSEYGKNFNSGFELSYKFSDFTAFSSFNQSMRLPTFTELYYNSDTKLGNVNLKAEEAITYEIGLKYNSKILSFNSAYFIRKSDNLIDWIKIMEGKNKEKFKAQNQTEITANGFEFSAKLKSYYIKKIKPFFSYFKISYSYNNLNKKEEKNIPSLYVMDYLKHKFNLASQHNLIYNFVFNCNFSWQHRNGSYIDINDNENEINYKPYELLDLRLSWNKNKYKIFIECSNVLNKKYRDFGYLIQPKAWLKMGIKYKI